MTQYTTKPWTYVGRRVTKEHLLAYFYLRDQEENIRGFKEPIVPAVIGEVWEITEDDTGCIYNKKNMGERAPKRLTFETEEKIIEWTALDATAVQVLAQEKANKKLAARASEYSKALAPLKKMAASLDHDSRSVFIQKVVADLWRR